MKVRAYVRVARGRNGKPMVAATVRPSATPLTDSLGHALPTVSFALDLVVPDGMFREAERVVAEVEIPESAAEIVAEVRQ